MSEQTEAIESVRSAAVDLKDACEESSGIQIRPKLTGTALGDHVRALLLKSVRKPAKS